MKRADAVFAVDTVFRLLYERLNYRMDMDAPSHAALRHEAIETLSASLEACPLNTRPQQFGRGHVYSHPSWGDTNCVYCGKAKP